MYRTQGYPVDLDARTRVRARRHAAPRRSKFWSLATRWLSS
jgi:hypothetical protein